ncbi:hypothetical protein WJX79_007016 [Trebouxia sp. C0005]
MAPTYGFTQPPVKENEASQKTPFQSGCMSMFSAGGPQPEQPVSEVQWADRDNEAEAQNDYAAAASQSVPGANSPRVPEGSQRETGSSPEADQSKLARRADHSRHISWDEAFLETPAGNGILDSGLEGQSNNRFAGPLLSDHQSKHSSLGNSEVHVNPTDTLGSSPTPDTTEYAEAAQTPSMSTSAVGTASVPVDSPGGSAQVAEGEKPKKGHRRGRSLTGLIPTLKTKPKRSQSQVMEGEPTTPAASSSQASRPKTPDAKAGPSASSSLGCFGMGKTVEEAEREEMPSGVVGLRNLGNTCFVNVALQCQIADSFKTLVKQVYDNSNQYAVDPAQFLRRIAQHPMGAEFCDGGQHDAQELFRLLLDSLHDDLNRISKKPAYEEHKDIPGEAETDKADRLWQKYLSIDNSPITDLFGGQLQSTVHCQKCKGNFTMYEPFWDLSLPIVKEGKGGIGAWLSGKKDPTSIQDCLQAFTSDELLQGDESFKCEKCDEKTQATKRLRIYRLPKVLLLHIKRFKYSGSSREKLTNNVSFPVKGLKLSQFVSDVSSPADSNASYDLYANRQGTVGIVARKSPQRPVFRIQEVVLTSLPMLFPEPAATQAACLTAYLLPQEVAHPQGCSSIILYKQLLPDFSMCTPQSCPSPSIAIRATPVVLHHQYMMTAVIPPPGQMNILIGGSNMQQMLLNVSLRASRLCVSLPDP